LSAYQSKHTVVVDFEILLTFRHVIMEVIYLENHADMIGLAIYSD